MAPGSALSSHGMAAALAALAPAATGSPGPTIVHVTIFGRAGADTLDLLAPVFIGFFAYFFVFLLTGVSFLRERIGGTLERLLATPIARGEIVLGYSLGFGIFATLQVTLFLAFSPDGRRRAGDRARCRRSTSGSGVPSAGSPLLAFAIALVLALGAVSLGIFLSTFARNELQIVQFIPVVIVPQALLAGIFWPVQTAAGAAPGRRPPVAPDLCRRGAPPGAPGRGDPRVGHGPARPGRADPIALLFVVLASGTIRREIA